MRVICQRFFLIACVCFGVGCASTGISPTTPQLPAADRVVADPQRVDYRVGPNDVLTVKIFQVEDLDREVKVDDSGRITLPLVGSVVAAGRTVAELESVIAGLYRARYLQDPQVSVYVKQAAGRRVTVEGAVGQPGIFPIDSRISLLQAIALARGPSNVANERNVIVFRTIDGRRQFARFDLRAIREGRAPDPELFGEDIVVVDESAGKVWLRRIVEATPLIGVWSVFR